MVSPSEQLARILRGNSARNNKHSFHTQGFRSQPRLPARTRPSSRRLSCHFHLQIAVSTRNTARVITCDLYFSPPAFSFFHGRKLRSPVRWRAAKTTRKKAKRGKVDVAIQGCGMD